MKRAREAAEHIRRARRGHFSRPTTDDVQFLQECAQALAPLWGPLKRTAG